MSKASRLLKAAGIDGGEFKFAGFVGGVDELAGDPVRTNDCETYHGWLSCTLKAAE